MDADDVIARLQEQVKSAVKALGPEGAPAMFERCAESAAREARPYMLTVGRYRFSYKWRSWGCDYHRGGVGSYGHPSPVAAFRDCRRAWRERIADGQRALYREQVAALPESVARKLKAGLDIAENELSSEGA